ncbi:MAG: FHA domain-containing protein [Candidatus Thiodiazotropha sp.]
MEKLVILGDDGTPQEFELLQRRMSIGRDAACDICLGDRSVSRHHASLLRVYQGFSIEDERSTNGTRVNGSIVTKRFLKHGDLIEIGKYSLRYIAQVAPQDEDPDRTVVLKPRSMAAPPAESAQSPQSETPANPSGVSASERRPAPASPAAAQTEAQPDSQLASSARVKFMAGDQSGEERVIDRAFFSVGNPGGDLVLINQRHNGYYLLKVGGENTPMINGQPIKAGGVALKDGDNITLGELSLKFLD